MLFPFESLQFNGGQQTDKNGTAFYANMAHPAADDGDIIIRITSFVDLHFLFF